ncbi:UDP-3-O-[3-hydroxymyristoyl] glucosamine N-acyltransferase [Roseimicrobium gellanilyticum]|uniref:UDP-3-O-acylglucosamine N-acyltransferase n=1 Tax=Roseimicrobium gellanilyticum TaxID=748857 RepID=A0A366HMQ9_9BACT|nr:UDP-3-O-(3-hydroxymyristoyl)glucosamine N-acyltransferase [Roseimicrobium gellanilyticum]RBP44452.1 UDP-3-O-[3-hydroxymyristoyl] glucosamine N-acyltransferase [Roseimicrobium gellanilyticum]
MSQTSSPPNRFRLSVGDLTQLVHGTSRSEDAKMMVEGFASLGEAQKGDVTFYTDVKHAAALRQTKATVILVPEDWESEQLGVAFIRVVSPTAAFDLVVDRYGRQAPAFKAGIHPTAVISDSVTFNAAKVCIGAHAVIEQGAIIGDGATIGASSYVGHDVTIGKDTKLHAQVTIQDGCVIGDRVILHSGVVIGADGFGYEFEAGRHRKVKQRGIVQVDADVEIGANSTVDRARYGRTWIGAGTKIDNLVQIGHNVVIGRHCILVACVAIAGSVVIADYVVIGAQAGIAGHVTIGPQARLGARCGVTKDLPGGQSYLGFPAVPAEKEKRKLAGVSRLEKLNARVRALEKMLEKLA